MERVKRIFSRRAILMIMLALNSMMSIACSTPRVPDKDSDAGNATWWSYESCLRKYGSARGRTMCNNVDDRNTGALSYNDYTYTSQGGSQAEYGEYLKAGDITQEQRDTAYRAYINALDEAAQKELARQWDEI